MNATSILPCTYNYPDLSSAARYVFGTAFILCGIMAAFGNTISLIILSKPCLRTKSNKFLMSLAIADALVGFILCPLTAVQLIKAELLTNCLTEVSRVFFSTAFCGVSAMMVALIAYDRYVLLSSLTSYHTKMTKKKIIILIFLAWFLPTIFQCLYVINGVLYLLFLCILTIGPFIILTVSYIMMAKKIKEKEKELKSHSKLLSSNNTENRKERKNLNLTRKLSLLIICYLICMLPALFNFVAEIVIRAKKEQKVIGLQMLTVSAVLCASANSVINPIIYISKYPEFKKEFNRSFRRTISKQPESLLDASNVSHALMKR